MLWMPTSRWVYWRALSRIDGQRGRPLVQWLSDHSGTSVMNWRSVIRSWWRADHCGSAEPPEAACGTVAHQGDDSCIKRARESIFWPGRAGDIRAAVEQCEICARAVPRQEREPLQQPITPEKAWSRVSVGLMTLDDHDYLVTVDNLSGYLETDRLRSQTASEVILNLSMTFARFGPWKTVLCDNGSRSTWRSTSRKQRDRTTFPTGSWETVPRCSQAPCVASLTAACAMHRYVPPLWKSANVSPLAKVNPPTQLQKHIRPISLTPVIAKVLEGFTCQWVTDTISEVIDPHQYGSVKGSSTVHALVELVHHWRQGLGVRVRYCGY